MVNRRTVQISDKAVETRSARTAEGERTDDPRDLMAVADRYQSPLLRYVAGMLDAADSESEDIVQETFVRLHRQVARNGSDSVRHLTNWLFKTAHNLTIDTLRKRIRRKQSELDVEEAAQLAGQSAADELDAVSEVLRREARAVTLRELAQLDDVQRQVILLKIIQGMTLRQVAEVVGVSVSLVNYRLNQGLAELARRLRKAGVV